jgi:hypothetical protein
MQTSSSTTSSSVLAPTWVAAEASAYSGPYPLQSHLPGTFVSESVVADIAAALMKQHVGYPHAWLESYCHNAVAAVVDGGDDGDVDSWVSAHSTAHRLWALPPPSR